MRGLKNYFILPKFQGKLVVWSIAPLVITFGILIYKFNESFDKLENHMRILGLHRNPQVMSAVQAQELLLNKYFYSGAVIGLAFMLISLIYISHKLAGPIYRLKKELRSIRESGNFKEIHFRKGDYLVEMEDDLNFCLTKNDEDKKAA